MARDLDVSRGPVREAFRQLAEQGLLVLSPHRGARLSALANEDAHELYSLMVASEHLALRLLRHRLATTLVTRLHSAVQAMRDAAHRGDRLGVARADLQFNDALFAEIGHGPLRHLWQDLKFQSYLLVRDYAALAYPSLSTMADHHANIVALVEHGEWDRLFAYLNENNDRIETRFLELSGAAATSPSLAP